MRLIEILKKFADDTKAGNRARTAEEREALQKALDQLCDWAAKWGMTFNISKCKVMHLGNGNIRQEYKMNGQILESVDEETDIGVKMARTLKPSTQCIKAAATAQTVLSQICRAFHYRDRHIFVRLYAQYVRPHVEFATPAWSPWSVADLECLEKVQKRAVQMVSGLQGRTYEERLTELGMTTLAERRHQTDMLQVYKILTGKDKVNSEQWFEMMGDGDRVTRAAADPLNMRIPAPRLEIRRHFFTQRVPAEWNRVPAALKRAPTVQSFRSGYRAYRRGEQAAVQPAAR